LTRGRYAPSPTGELHLGNLRTALVAWLSARSAGGEFLLRIEDLDSTRSNEDWVAIQMKELETIGVDWDGEVVRQSERGGLYRDALERLDREGLVYECFCTRREIHEAASAPHGDLPEGAYPGTCRDLTTAEIETRRASGRPPALRVRAGGARIAFRDGIHGELEGGVDDFVVRRNDGDFGYNFAVVIDDADQGVTEVVRGDDLLDSTPRQAWLYRTLGLNEPSAWFHLPLMLGTDGQRLAKRHGAVTLEQQLEAGRTAAALVGGFAASLGLAPQGEHCLARDLVETFDWDVVRKAASDRPGDLDFAIEEWS
jgi:glutamyl-tRNA synthetase